MKTVISALILVVLSSLLFAQTSGAIGSVLMNGKPQEPKLMVPVANSGKYISFNRGVDSENANFDIYWLSANVIDELRTKALNDH